MPEASNQRGSAFPAFPPWDAGEAVINYRNVRLTGDGDFFSDLASENGESLLVALAEFWVGDIPGVMTASDLSRRDQVLQFGRPPNLPICTPGCPRDT
ncbi:MAG: hypothetical protein ACI80V_000921 [Rhodothermales bacterium]|jgi:hypothetical protein